MINPDNEKPNHKIHGQKYFNSDVSKNFPSVLRWLALMYAILSIIGISLLMRPTKKDENLVEASEIEECPNLKEGVKTKRFWFLFGMALMSITPGLYIMNVYKTFGKSQIDNDQFLTVVGSVSSIFNGSFRYLWGIFMDRFSFKKSYALLIAVQTCFIVTLFYVAKIEALYLIWVCVIVCCEGGHFTLFPAVVARMYGKG
jgi:Na+/melibiose symporter-like transporter